MLLAVFIPVGFFPGTTGQLYKQFALTIAAAITISLFQALTLAPVLSARLLTGEDPRSNSCFFRWFNRGLQALPRLVRTRSCPGLFRYRWLVAGVFAGALALTGFLFGTTPQAFIPDEDQATSSLLVQAPEGTSLEGEQAIAKKAEAIIRAAAGGRSISSTSAASASRGAAPNRGIMFALLHAVGRPQVLGLVPRSCFFAMPA